MAQDRAPEYGGALAGETRVDPEKFDPIAWTKARHDAAPLKLTFRATTRKQAEAWQKQLHAKIVELIGPLPATGGPLHAQTLDAFASFRIRRREKFVFESRPGVGVLGYLLTPKTAAAHATVVCVPGHGRGVDDIVGIDEHGRDRTTRSGYEYDFAIQAVEHGLAAVAIEPMAFGCRRDAATKAKGAASYVCQPVAGSALLLGETMIAIRN